MQGWAVFKGTREEEWSLVEALSAHCTCDFAPDGQPLALCSVHQMQVSDQRALNGLLFMRRNAERLWGPAPARRVIPRNGETF